MKVGVIASNPDEDDVLIPEIRVATKVRNSLFSGIYVDAIGAGVAKVGAVGAVGAAGIIGVGGCGGGCRERRRRHRRLCQRRRRLVMTCRRPIGANGYSYIDGTMG